MHRICVFFNKNVIITNRQFDVRKKKTIAACTVEKKKLFTKNTTPDIQK